VGWHGCKAWRLSHAARRRIPVRVWRPQTLAPYINPNPNPNPDPTLTRYPAPFFGQPGAGTPYHCPIDAPSDVNITACPRVVTSSDDDREGPGPIPGHVAIEALLHAHRFCDPELKRWFASSCRISGVDLLTAIRKIYPARDDYPPPTNEWPIRNLDFPSPQGPPHFCDANYRATGMWVDYCPCVFCAPPHTHPRTSLHII